MDSPLFYYVCAVIAVIISGLAKGGFAGIGLLAVPIMALAIDPVKAAAILLPILMLQDIVGVWAFRHSWDGYVLKVMLPGMAVGVLGGYLFAAKVPESTIMGALGVISVLFGLQRLWIERGGAMVLPSNSPAWVGVLFGMATGFTSQIAHAGGPPFQMWVLPRRLPRDVLAGTTAFAVMALNWMKVPAYAALGQLTRENLMETAMLAPVAMAATLGGVALVRRVDPARFYTVIYVLMVLVGGKLMADAILA
ncbi:MAG: sulfite exporter TauE/SafE family protein [Sphingobium sp.]